MKFVNTINSHMSDAVNRLNKLDKLNNKFIFIYEESEDWYSIIHSVEDEIQKSDRVALEISDILLECLINNGIMNFSMYEDKEIVNRNTIKFLSEHESVFSNKSIRNTKTLQLTSKINKHSTVPKIA